MAGGASAASSGTVATHDARPRDAANSHNVLLLIPTSMKSPAHVRASNDRTLDPRYESRRPDISDESAEKPARLCVKLRSSIVRGQYAAGWVGGEPVPGYREEPEVDPQSETETFVAGCFTIAAWRWRGVPFYLRAGRSE